MKRVVREQRLGFVATVCPDGTPNLSPKGTTVVWDDEHLVFLHLHSPGTVANLATNPAIEVNVVDPIRRKGYRFKGRGEALTDGDLYEPVIDWFHRHRGTKPDRIKAVVLVRVEAVGPLISPVYDSGASEAEVVEQWRRHHLQLTDPACFHEMAGAPVGGVEFDFFCNLGALDASQRERHGRLASELVARITGIEELPDGYALGLPVDSALLAPLVEWVSLERRCCPFLHFNVRLTPEILRLELSGPPGVKLFLQSEFSLVLAGR
jgi:hypothetical protein